MAKGHKEEAKPEATPATPDVAQIRTLLTDATDRLDLMQKSPGARMAYARAKKLVVEAIRLLDSPGGET